MHYLTQLTSENQNILLLQGPNGAFFYTLAQWLRKKDKSVFKINFNGGDAYFYPSTTENTEDYTGDLERFNAYLTDFIMQNKIDAVVCFGDNRRYHRAAKSVVETLENVSFWAFEEGYFRPHFITLEKNGVNAFTGLPSDIRFFVEHTQSITEFPPAVDIHGGFRPMADKAIRYYVAMSLKQKQYPHYHHHREDTLIHYGLSWCVSFIRRLGYFIRDKSFTRKAEQGQLGKFFILPLQVYNDSQLRTHSDFASVRDCLEYVLTSFALHGDKEAKLIVKHHPMDRGFVDYRQTIKTYIKKYPQLKERVIYIHDVSLPALLRKAVGMVTMNSTAGLSALIHHMPVKVIGRSHYDIDGLTFQCPLDEFWQNPTPPNADYFKAYHLFHMHTTQINGNFYSEVKLPD